MSGGGRNRVAAAGAERPDRPGGITGILQFLATAALVCLIVPVAILPARLVVAAGRGAGFLLFTLWRSRRRIAIENIDAAIRSGTVTSSHPAREIAKRSFMHLVASFAEIGKIYLGFGKAIVGNVEIRGADNYRAARAKNRGVIFITGHCGNWELLAVACSAAFHPISVVARAQNNPYLNRLIEKARARYGNRVIYKRGALRGILSELRSGGTVGILIDQAVLRSEGVIVDFLGRKAWTSKTPALIARKSGAALVPAFIHRKEDGTGHVIEIHPEVELPADDPGGGDLASDMGLLSRSVEDYVRRYPEEWLWIHRRWKRTEGY